MYRKVWLLNLLSSLSFLTKKRKFFKVFNHFYRSWIDIWDLLAQECREEVVLVDADSLLETLENYLRKHRLVVNEWLQYLSQRNLWHLLINMYMYLRRLGHQQINRQIYFKFLIIIRYAIKYYYLVKKNSINLNF